jgi:hypothetical protein
MASTRRAATAASVALVLSAAAAHGEVRTDRLSERALERWWRIVSIVGARDSSGHPLHPRIHGLWEAVEASGCVVQVELPEPKGYRPYVVGHFSVTRVDEDGRAAEGRIVLNLAAIDHAATGPGAARSNGFVPFASLGRWERYAEVLGHELAHAIWAVSDPERTRLTVTLPQAVEEASRQVLAAMADRRDDGRRDRADALDRVQRTVEAPAEAEEEAVWAELAVARPAR